MMQPTTLDKTQLAAFADGELSPEDAAAVVMHLADHPGDQAFVDDLMAANQTLVRAFSASMTQPVPSAILAAIDRGPAQARIFAFVRHRYAAFAGLAIAASVVLAAVLAPGAVAPILPPGQVAYAHPLYHHLQSLPSGQTIPIKGGQEMTILASLPTETGHCREVEVIDRAANRLDMALACTAGAGWWIEVALSEPLPEAVEELGYIPAGGIETDALTPWLDRLGAGMVLKAETEASLIAQGWAR